MIDLATLTPADVGRAVLCRDRLPFRRGIAHAWVDGGAPYVVVVFNGGTRDVSQRAIHPADLEWAPSGITGHLGAALDEAHRRGGDVPTEEWEQIKVAARAERVRIDPSVAYAGEVAWKPSARPMVADRIAEEHETPEWWSAAAVAHVNARGRCATSGEAMAKGAVLCSQLALRSRS